MKGEIYNFILHSNIGVGTSVANEFYFEEGLDHSLKHFHLVILDAIRNTRDPDCDCCCKRWHDCQCWCSNCGSEYPVCRASCYQLLKQYLLY